ncbi:MAG: AMP-binding protein [archaeon]|nr:AMP-binding protein [archaeon]
MAMGRRRQSTAEAGISHLRGADFPPLLEESIGVRFRHQLERYHDKVFLSVVRPTPVRLTWEGMHARIQGLCRSLIDLGFEKGDRVGLWMPTRVEWLVAQLATSQLGLVNVSLNTAYRPEELGFSLNNVQCKGIIMSPDRKTHPNHAHPNPAHPNPAHPHSSQSPTLSNQPTPAQSHPDRGEFLRVLMKLAPELAIQHPHQLALEKLPHLRHVICATPYRGYCELPMGVRTFDEMASASCSVASDLEIDKRLTAVLPRDPVSIQFTSGTTGLPKGATLTHLGILNNALFLGERFKVTSEDILNICVPQYHCFGQVMGNLVALNYGCHIVFPDEQFDPRHTAEACLAESCTALYGVPSMWMGVIDQPAFRMCTTLNKGMVAGALCPPVLYDRLVNEHHITGLLNAYGMTETSPVSFTTSSDDPKERRLNSVGHIMPHTECKIVGPSGATVPLGSRGELWTKGYSVCLGYWGDEEKTKEAIQPGGWMRTGDEAIFDEEGYCSITGRIKDIIIRGGENIYPIAIENYLLKHPLIRDVAVFGVPDPHYGEVVAAWIKLRSPDLTMSAHEVTEFCKGQIAHFNVPKLILFRDDFPQTLTGKIKKFEMRAETMRIFQILDH